jgi:peptide/nickel transport system permease protein
LVLFFLSKSTPGDPIADLVQLQDNSQFGNETQKGKEYCRKYRELELDKAVFYFSLRSSVLHDDIRKICDYNKRKWFKAMSLEVGDYKIVQEYNTSVNNLRSDIESWPDSLLIKREIRSILNKLIFETNISKIKSSVSEISNAMELGNISSPYSGAIRNSLSNLISRNNSIKKWIPSFHWYGFNNQYHKWMYKLLKLDFGESMKDGQKVFTKIWQSFKWTGLMVLMSFILTLVIGVPLGVFLASKKDSRKDKVISTFLYLLYSIPIFWLATLLVVFFTTNEYGSWNHLFTSILPLTFRPSESFWLKFIASSKYLILPVFCIAIHSIAYISRLTRSSMIDQMDQLYVRTAKSKGISEQKILWKHSFRNALIPIVSLLIAAIPASFAGSLVIEVIFNIPGMGRLIFESVFGNDWPVLYGATMLIGLVTIIVYLIGDIFYRFVNPKISYSK